VRTGQRGHLAAVVAQGTFGLGADAREFALLRARRGRRLGRL
jgi:hypothetical protein